MAMNINKDLSQKLPLAKNDIYSPVGAPSVSTTNTYNLPDQRCKTVTFFNTNLENWISAVIMQMAPADI